MNKSRSKITTDHETIKNWVEERNGVPAAEKGTGDKEPGLLRIDFLDPKAGDRDKNLIGITWEEFFGKFEERNLAFLFEDEIENGKLSRFFKFVDRSEMDHSEPIDPDERTGIFEPEAPEEKDIEVDFYEIDEFGPAEDDDDYKEEEDDGK